MATDKSVFAVDTSKLIEDICENNTDITELNSKGGNLIKHFPKICAALQLNHVITSICLHHKRLTKYKIVTNYKTCSLEKAHQLYPEVISLAEECT